MIDKIVQTNKCFGCASCLNICPQKAIKMNQDVFGFEFPNVNYDKCINCGICLRGCPSINEYTGEPKLPLVFRVRTKDENDLHESTSGGIFTVISNYVLKNSGYICGAIFSKDLVIHIISNDFKKRNNMRGAKYVQSHLNNVFIEIKNLLVSGKMVLFTGTPCQVHALKLFLNNKEFGNLITIDILCHGVGSPAYFSSYYKRMEFKYKSEIERFIFRSKNIGWRGNNVEIIFKNGLSIKNCKDTNKYTELYGKGFLMMEACYNCPYSTVFRVGDFSIGDCWGIEKTTSLFNDNKGCSLVFVNTEKAKTIFKKNENEMYIENAKMQDSLQHNLLAPTKKPKAFDKTRSQLKKKIV